MKEITRKLLKYLVWMKPSKGKDAARRGTEADPRNAKNGGRKRDDEVGVVVAPAAVAPAAVALNAVAPTTVTPAAVTNIATTDIAPTDMSPATIRCRLEGAGTQEEVAVDDRSDNDLSNSRRSDAEDEAAILSRDFEKLNIGFPAIRGAQPASSPTPPTMATTPAMATTPTRVPGAAVLRDTSSTEEEDVKKEGDIETKQQKDVDAEDDDDEEEAREFKATMMRLSLTVSKTEVDTFLERGPTARFPGSVARDHGPYHGAYRIRGARLEEGDVLMEGLVVPRQYPLDYEDAHLLIGVELPNLAGDEVADLLANLGGPKETSNDFSREYDGADSSFQSAPDGASDGYPSPHQFHYDPDSSDSNGSDCVSTRLTEIGRLNHFKQRISRDSIVSQPSPDSVTSVSSPGSPWSTSTEGSSKSCTPPQMCRSDPPAQPPHYPLPEKTPPNFVDKLDLPYHTWMRSQFMGKAKLEGYGWDKANKSPELITLLRDAEKTGRADHQRIYECARGHMKYHIALLYEKDDHDKTALYYAARLHFDDRVAGFVAECLVEAQERCLKSNCGRRYRVDEELYGDDKDNIFHCLARWHRHDESYVAMAGTLLSFPYLVTLLDRPNRAGLLPVDLCRHSDLRAMLDPRKGPYVLGASLLPVMPATPIFLPCLSQR